MYHTLRSNDSVLLCQIPDELACKFVKLWLIKVIGLSVTTSLHTSLSIFMTASSKFAIFSQF